MRKSHAVDVLFAVALFTLFAILSLLLVLGGADSYRGVVRDTRQNNEARVSLSYVTNKVRAYDRAGAVRVEERDGIAVLVLEEAVENTAFQTLIYAYDGALRELYLRSGFVFHPENGTKIAGAERFLAETDGALVIVTVTVPGAQAVTAKVACSGRGRAA